MPKFPTVDTYGHKRTPYAVLCQGPYDVGTGGHGLVYLTRDEYNLQMSAPNKTWRCPLCRYEAVWSDANYEQMTEEGVDIG